MDRILSTHQIGSNLRVGDVVSYLRKKNWRPADHRNKRMLVFLGPNDDAGKPITLVLPTSDEYQDTKARISEAINLLAIVEDRSPSAIINSIVFFHGDVLNARIIGDSVRPDSIPLPLATRLLSDFRYMIACAARLEEKPEPYFFKTSRQAEALARRCRFGQTFSGSFGFRIEIPVPVNPAVGEFQDQSIVQTELFGLKEQPPSIPLERRVMIRMVRGLKMIGDSISNQDVNILVQKYEEGFNGNIYETLQNTYNEFQELELGYSVSWSPEWPVTEDMRDMGEVSIIPRSYPYIETAANELKGTFQPKETLISGQVVQLKAEDLSLEYETVPHGSDCTIIIRDDHQDKKSIRVQVQLNVEDYRKACDAHKQGCKVRVAGILQKQGKLWVLISPTDFQVE
jgi:hypothetical protein